MGTSIAKLKAAYPHQLHETSVYLSKVEILPGPKGQAMAFVLGKSAVTEIATGSRPLLTQGEYCG